MQCQMGCFGYDSPCAHMRTGEDEIVVILEDDSPSEVHDPFEKSRLRYQIEDRILRERSVREALEQKEREKQADWERRISPYAMACTRLMYVGQKLVRVEPWI